MVHRAAAMSIKDDAVMGRDMEDSEARETSNATTEVDELKKRLEDAATLGDLEGLHGHAAAARVRLPRGESEPTSKRARK